MPGLLAITTLRFQNAVVRAMASATGLPSVPADNGYLSASSKNATRTDRPDKLAAELAPPNARKPPLKLVRRNVFCESRLRGSGTNPRNLGQSRIIGLNLSLENASASSTVGSTTSIGHGSMSMKKPTAFKMQSVTPTGGAF